MMDKVTAAYKQLIERLIQWAQTEDNIRAVEALSTAFAHYAEEDIWRALFATMKLFRWLALETAELLEYAYPSLGEARATEFVQQLFSGRTRS
jgi:hypothetical protein